MMLGSKDVFGGFMFRVGRDYWRGRGTEIAIFSGFLKDADLGEIPWRHYWHWSSTSLPRLAFHKFSWRRAAFALPCGFVINGRWRIFWGNR